MSAANTPPELTAHMSTAFSDARVYGRLLARIAQSWLEHHMAQEIVAVAEDEGGRLPGSVTVTLLFCDLKDFSAFA